MVSVRSAMDARKRMGSGSNSGGGGTKIPPGASPTIATTPQMVSTPSTPQIIKNSSSNSGSIRHVRSVSTLAPLSKVKLLLEKGHDNINKLSKFDVHHCSDPEFSQLVTSRATEFMPRCDIRKLPLFWVQACSVEYFNKLAVDYAAIRDEWLSMDRRGKEAAKMYAGARSSSSSGFSGATSRVNPVVTPVVTPVTLFTSPELPRQTTGGVSIDLNRIEQLPKTSEAPKIRFQEPPLPKNRDIPAQEAVFKEPETEQYQQSVVHQQQEQQQQQSFVQQEVQDADKQQQQDQHHQDSNIPDAEILSDKAPPGEPSDGKIVQDEGLQVDEDRFQAGEDDRAETSEEDKFFKSSEASEFPEENQESGDNENSEQMLPSLTPDNRPGKSLGVRDLSRLAPLCEVRPLLFASNPWCRKFDIKYCSDPQFAENLARCAETYLGPDCDLGKLPAYIVQACYVEHFLHRSVDFASLRDDWLFHRGGRAGREKLEEEAAAGYLPAVPDKRLAKQEEATVVNSAERQRRDRVSEKDDLNSDDGFQPRKKRRRSTPKRQVDDLNLTPTDSPPESDEPDIRDAQRYRDAEAKCKELQDKFREFNEGHDPATTGVEPMDQEAGPMDQEVGPRDHDMVHEVEQPSRKMDSQEAEIQKRCEEAVARYKLVAEAESRAKCQEVENRYKKIAEAKCKEVENRLKWEARDALARYKEEFEARVADAEAKFKEAEAKMAEESRNSANRLLKAFKRVEVLPTDHAPEELHGEPLAGEVFDKETRSKECPMCSQRFTSEGWYTLGTCGHRYHLQCLLLHAFSFCSCAVCKTGLPCEFYRTIGHESFVE